MLPEGESCNRKTAHRSFHRAAQKGCYMRTIPAVQYRNRKRSENRPQKTGPSPYPYHVLPHGSLFHPKDKCLQNAATYPLNYRVSHPTVTASNLASVQLTSDHVSCSGRTTVRQDIDECLGEVALKTSKQRCSSEDAGCSYSDCFNCPTE